MLLSPHTYYIIEPPSGGLGTRILKVLLALMAIAGLLIIAWSYHETLTSLLEIPALQGQPEPQLLLGSGGGLLGIAILVFLFLKLRPGKRDTPVIGELIVSRIGIRATVDKDFHQWNWPQVKRMNVYFSNSIKTGKKARKGTPFTELEALQVRVKSQDGVETFHVQNWKKDKGEKGDLFFQLDAIRKQTRDMYIKIQFWDKYVKN